MTDSLLDGFLSLRLSLAMAANVTDRLWSMEDVVARMDAMAPASRSTAHTSPAIQTETYPPPARS